MTMFEREDWTLFRNLNTLGQRAGVPREAIPKLVIKELVDNALDAAVACRFGVDDEGWICVEDGGDGLPGSDEEVASLFSVSRPLSSSKLLRLPTRGALGNGLRVVTGAVLASGGELVVKTRGRACGSCPKDDGTTEVERIGSWEGSGTLVKVLLGESLAFDHDAFEWADQALRMAASQGDIYKGKTSPWWYDSDSFFELTQAAGKRPVRELVASFAGCSGERPARFAADFMGRPSNSLSRDEAESLLAGMRRKPKGTPEAARGCRIGVLPGCRLRSTPRFIRVDRGTIYASCRDSGSGGGMGIAGCPTVNQVKRQSQSNYGGNFSAVA